MIHLYDRAGFAGVHSLAIDPALRQLLAARIAALPADLIDQTEYLVVEPGDTEEDIVRHIGLTPLAEPFEGRRWREPGFWPHWDLLEEVDGHYVMTFTFGGAFAYVLIIPQVAGTPADLIALCRQYARGIEDKRRRPT